MAPSPDGVIDLTGSDSDFDDPEQESRFSDIRRHLDSSCKKKRKRDRAGKASSGPTEDDEIIVLDSEDDDIKAAATPTATSSKKRKKPKVKNENDEDKKKASIKQEGCKPAATTAKPTSIAEDGLEFLEDVGPQMVPAAAEGGTANIGDDDVILEGVANELRLPHLRQDCTNNPFVASSTNHTTKKSSLLKNRLTTNYKHCDLCYCFVCDCPVKDCGSWYLHDGSSKAKNNHCCAVNNVSVWQQLRKEAKKSKSPAAASTTDVQSTPNTSENSVDGVPPGKHLVKSCAFSSDFHYYFDGSDLCGSFWCYVCDKNFVNCSDKYSHRNADPTSQHWQDQRAIRSLSTYGKSGPFPPDCEDASKDPGCKKCRHCSWFGRYKTDGGLSDDWCSVCGLVGDASSLSKNQATAPTEEEMKDLYFFGEKQIPFRMHSHDPREFSEYRSKWSQNSNWQYDESDRDEETFLHLLGKSPTIRNVYNRVACSPSDKIPKNGSNAANIDNTDAVLIDDPNHINLIHMLSIENVADHTTVSATWDKELRSGTLKVSLLLPKNVLLGSHGGSRQGTFQRLLPAIMASWCGFAFDVSEISQNVEPSAPCPKDFKRWSKTGIVAVPFDARIVKAKLHADATNQMMLSKFDECATSRAEHVGSLSLCSSANDGGGVSGSETSFRDRLLCFFREQFPMMIAPHEYVSVHDAFEDLLRCCIGQNRSGKSLYSCDLDIKMLEFVCGFSDATIARLFHTKNFEKARLSEPVSIDEIMISLENLGHASEEFVEGLNVELLPFQKQALKWALEREQTPGGIQSFYWSKLPDEEGRPTDLYYNPILSHFRKDKPDVVRGGILAAAMGLGKTIISLGLILKNPAPDLPVSGSLVTALDTATPPISGEGWDKSLYGKTSTENDKRGSILSRGTLVICPVSLVGQWIDEAKSRLKNPGLVYPYHGQSRKRDAKKLADAAIVVTTYQVLASDATYHKKKSGEGYCAPLEQVRWWRIIADEGHSLREGNTQRNHAVQALVADNKWIVSGTPVSTDPKELRNLFKFLGIEASTNMFGFCTAPPHRRKSEDLSGNAALLMNLLRPVVLRYSHGQTYRGTSTTLMSLPPMKKRTIDITFSPSEKEEFGKLEKAAQDFYLEFRRRHIMDMSRHFLKVSSKLMPLRAASAGGKYPLQASSASSIEEDDDEERDPDDTGGAGGRKKGSRTPVKYSDFVFESKAKVLVSELKKIRDDEPDSKSLIFSQFASTLEYLQELLPQHGFAFRTLKGNMSMKQRAKALHDFQNDPPTTVFLLSMRSGAVGINLTQANRVFLMEPGFNPALEAQAIGRVHRLGQKRNVEICRLVMKDSFESRMVNFLKKKYKLTFDDNEDSEMDKKPSTANNSDDGTIIDDEAEDAGAPEKKAKAIVPVIVGNLQTERAQVVTEEFDELFGVQDRVIGEAESTEPMDEYDEFGDDDNDIFPDGAVSGSI